MKLAGEVAVNGPGRGIHRDRVHAGQGRSEVALIARTAAGIEAAAQRILVEGTARAYALDIVDREAVARAFAAAESELSPISWVERPDRA
jgi:NADP-dependent 3-hydroxy acid dehydrogenase YdfG